jgi:serine/threonine-protein kinase RsbW
MYNKVFSPFAAEGHLGERIYLPRGVRMSADPKSLTLTLPSDVRMLSVARAFVEAVCQAHQLEKPVMHALVLATGEAVSNIVRHAHRNRSDAHLEIRFTVGSEAIEIAFLDEGEPFHLESVPELDPSELRVGGRGVYLMRALVDELSCQPRADRGNTLRMVKRRTDRAASPTGPPHRTTGRNS